MGKMKERRCQSAWNVKSRRGTQASPTLKFVQLLPSPVGSRLGISLENGRGIVGDDNEEGDDYGGTHGWGPACCMGANHVHMSYDL